MDDIRLRPSGVYHPQRCGITNTYHSASHCIQHSFRFCLDPYWRSMLFTTAIVLCSITHACTQKETRCGDLFKWNILCRLEDNTARAGGEATWEKGSAIASLNLSSIVCHWLWPFKTRTLDTLSISRFQGIYFVLRYERIFREIRNH